MFSFLRSKGGAPGLQPVGAGRATASGKLSTGRVRPVGSASGRRQACGEQGACGQPKGLSKLAEASGMSPAGGILALQLIFINTRVL